MICKLYIKSKFHNINLNIYAPTEGSEETLIEQFDEKLKKIAILYLEMNALSISMPNLVRRKSTKMLMVNIASTI